MAGSQIGTSITILDSLLGFQAISLTNPTTSAESLIAAGSKVEIAGAFFSFTSNETPNATSWTAVGTGNIAFYSLIPAGTAGSQTVTAEYIATAPVWSVAKQGYYASAASNSRVVASVYKTGTAQYDNVLILPNRHKESAIMWVPLGEWDMDATATVTLGHGLTAVSILNTSVVIHRDDDVNAYPITYVGLTFPGGTVSVSGNWYHQGHNIIAGRIQGQLFDSANFDGTASTVPNRGWAIIALNPEAV